MSTKAKLNVQSFPRPPLLEQINRHVQVKYKDQVIAETREPFWVLETHHPPTYYIPRSAFSVPLSQSSRTSYCEWKGRATYWDLTLSDGTTVRDKAWSYESPSPRHKPIKGFLSLYANAPWECYVDNEKVQPQEGDFYGGWATSEIEGQMKGGPGTLGW